MKSATVTRNKSEQASNSCTVKLTGVTQGELAAILNALGIYSSCSIVAESVSTQVRHAALSPGGFPEVQTALCNLGEFRVERLPEEELAAQAAVEAECKAMPLLTPYSGAIEPGTTLEFKDGHVAIGDIDAFKYLTDRGYSIGTQCRDLPRAIKHKGLESEGYDIAKWRNLGPEEHALMDGEIRAVPGGVVVELYSFERLQAAGRTPRPTA